MSEPQEYTVTAVLYNQEKDGKYGRMRSLDLDLEGVGKVNWYTKAETRIPSPGDKLTGTLEDGQYGLKFRKADGPGTRVSVAPSERKFERQPEHPLNAARMLRSHSQEMALRYLDLIGAGQEARERGLNQSFKETVDFFCEDVESYVDKKVRLVAQATPAPPDPSPGGASNGNVGAGAGDTRAGYPTSAQINRAAAIAKQHRITNEERQLILDFFNVTKLAELPDREAYDQAVAYLERKLPIPDPTMTDIPLPPEPDQPAIADNGEQDVPWE